MSKSVLITGCSGGLGNALAREFKMKGLRVFASARNLSTIDSLQEEGIEIIELDVVSEVSIKKAFADVNSKTGGKLHYLVNNSGIGYTMPLLDSDLTIAKKVFDVNVFGLVTVTQIFAPLLIASKGTLINISSITSKAPMPFMGMYNSTKAAVNIISDTMRIELEPFDITVVNVITGTIDTPFFETQPDATLPQDSLYMPIAPEYIMSTRRVPEGSMKPRDYARGVVANALKPKPNLHYWRGGSASLVWFVTSFLPLWVMDSSMAAAGKLNLLRSRLGKPDMKTNNVRA